MRSRARRAVVLGLIIGQAVLLLVLFAVSGRWTDRAAADQQQALLAVGSAESVDRMRTQIEPAEALVALAASTLSSTAIDPAELAPAFRDALDRSPQLDGAFVGTERGDFVFVTRTDDGYAVKTISVDGARRVENRVLAAGGGELERSLDPDDPYDPTTRPWYLAAVEAPGDTIWTDPYVFFTSGSLGITAARQVVRPDGSIVVVGADIELASLSAFLSDLRLGEGGGAVIADEDAVVLAHPDPAVLQVEGVDGPRTVTVPELADPAARAALASFVEAGVDAEGVATEYVFDGRDSQASFRSVPVGTGAWTVGIFGPDDAHVAGLADARATERRLTLAAGIVTILLVVGVALPATRALQRLEHQASTDSLTGVANRRRSLERLDELVDGPGAVAIVDLDHFKAINDTHGHQVGDEVLRRVTERIGAQLRPGSTVGRLGGEEFVVILPDASLDEARSIAERVRVAIAADPVATELGPVRTTASIGVAATEPGTEPAAALARADAALFEAKAGGRNRVAVADAALSTAG